MWLISFSLDGYPDTCPHWQQIAIISYDYRQATTHTDTKANIETRRISSNAIWAAVTERVRSQLTKAI